MYRYQIGIPTLEYDQFVKEHELVNVLQSSAWEEVKSDWQHEKFGAYRGDKLLATASILIKTLPLGYRMFYIPRGPVLDYKDAELLNFVLQSIKSYARSKRAIFVIFDPSICLSQSSIKHEKIEYPENMAIIENLQRMGVRWSGKTDGMGDTIQPRIQAKVYKENFTEDKLCKSTKQAIRSARNKGVEIQIGRDELLESFSFLMKKTEKRKDIHLRNEAYYKKLLDNFKDKAYITLATLDIAKRLRELEEQLAKNLALEEAFTESTRTSKVEAQKKEKERLVEERDFLQRYLNEEKSNIPLAATLSLEFGNTSVNLYAGMDDAFKRYNAPILAWYETARYAFERGMVWQNLGGVENSLNGGLYHFKEKFNPTIEEYLGEFTMPTHPLYSLLRIALDFRKALRTKHHRR
ncbi:UDP-N-acetylmuramoylpentapeptide-lysine N(6)-alanyltransferase [Streptococcus mitis]|uniref:Serine/alanine-adding enzyme MurM n=1 Tax=Streptococcus mitis TaxID=28037 RepID=A0AAX2L510_STRMT|nr:aminoacyltransferase [Streptococcus mitis]MBZ2102860.1 aminoacyltransferase [Streptococcus mitis]OOS16359.1 UDP-N-acetylmuramoylpentapeptide-lysine N(6)-alanyltransferase [Streptococcus mitis]QBZ12181.1 acetyltransferase domain protein [Streptococcus mitis NCTC 12261]QGS42695.1 peptidoglycan bridge formation glycyltransferase FemA/FemB family protein [Streptococcus mitis]QXA55341.1 aminoacyltransferase [Streptococcus mitis]